VFPPQALCSPPENLQLQLPDPVPRPGTLSGWRLYLRCTGLRGCETSRRSCFDKLSMSGTAL